MASRKKTDPHVFMTKASKREAKMAADLNPKGSPFNPSQGAFVDNPQHASIPDTISFQFAQQRIRVLETDYAALLARVDAANIP